MDKKIIIASGPVIVENGMVWLNKETNDDFWKFLGGQVHEADMLPDETQSLENACHRKSLEENDGDVEIIASLKPMLIQKPNDPGTCVVLIHWLAKRLGDFRPVAKTIGVREFEIEKLLIGGYSEEKFAPNIIPVLKNYFELLNKGLLK